MRPVWLLTLMAITGVACIVCGYHEGRSTRWADRVCGVVLVISGFLMAAVSTLSLNGY